RLRGSSPDRAPRRRGHTWAWFGRHRDTERRPAGRRGPDRASGYRRRTDATPRQSTRGLVSSPAMKSRASAAVAITAIVTSLSVFVFDARAEGPPSSEPAVIPFGPDAFTMWDRWPVLRIGVRAYMRSTFDRRGLNHNADSSQFLRQIGEPGALRGVALDE